MELNLPIIDQLTACKNLLIAGMGGGFDIFCGLPIYFELTRRGLPVHLANFSFSDITFLKSGIRLTPTLVGVQADQQDFAPYFPELYLSQWFAEKRQQSVTLWCFAKTGTRPLLENYRLLVERLDVDGILLIDGGVDSLVRGDEAATGTLIEDATSLFVVNELTAISTRLVACLGFGAEQDLSYGHILENMATLTQNGGFLGSCALVPHMSAYRAYEEAVLYVQNRPLQDPSVINSSIISAVRGQYGNYHLTEKTRQSHLWISPLMALYWFFDLPVLAQHNLYLPHLRDTDTFMAALHAMRQAMQSIPRRRGGSIPL
jgi:hypothetical protein